MTSPARFGLCTALALAVACGGDDRARQARQPTPIDPATTGTIEATVRFDGTPPAMRPLNMSSVAECAAAHREPAPSGDALVRDGKVENAFVWIQNGLGDRVFAVPATPVVIDQAGCLYVPHVAGAQVGQRVEFRNSDALLHNVHGSPKDSSSWNLSLARKGAERTVTVDHPEVAISVRCDVHPWMQGWIGVVDHPYFRVTGPDGRVTLPGVPAGEYTLAAWHERFGTRTATVTVKPGSTTDASFTFTAAGGN